MSACTEATFGFIVPADHALIGVPIRHHGRDITQFFTNEEEADAALGPAAADEALRLVGSWNDLPWQELADGLDHAGSWSAEDADAAIEYIYKAREEGTRPATRF